MEEKQRLINNVKRETDICLHAHFDNKITPRLSRPGDVIELSKIYTVEKRFISKQLPCFCRLLMYNFHLFSLHCNISSGGIKIIRFLLFEFVLCVFFAEDFSIRIDKALLKRNFFNKLLLVLRCPRNRSE